MRALMLAPVRPRYNNGSSIGFPLDVRAASDAGKSVNAQLSDMPNCCDNHVLPTLGERPLQQLRSTEIDTLYVTLADKISPRNALHVHSVLNDCLGTATRTQQIARNPMRHVVKVPSPGEPDHGIALDQKELRKLLEGVKGLSLFPIVAVAAFTGARRGEILALRWEDFDTEAKILRIERSVDDTDKHGLRIKGPKTERGKRTITIDDDLVSLLVSERDRYLRIVAGVPDGVSVDLSLVKLPAGALIFPSPVDDLAKPRHPRAVQRSLRKGSGLLDLPSCGFTISGARMKPCC